LQFSDTTSETTTVNETAGIPPVIDVQPRITVTKYDDPDPVFNGSSLMYTIAIASNGNGTAQNVTLHETIPANVTFIASIPAPTIENNTWSLGNITNGSTYEVNITVEVFANATNNSILTNNVNVTYENATAQLSDTDVETTTVNETAGIQPDVQPYVTVQKTDTPDPVFNASNIVYTITINNSGNGTAQNVTVHETLPSNVTFVSSQPAPSVENTTWSLGNLSDGTMYEVNITVQVNANATNNSILTNNVNVTYENATVQFSDTDSETTTVNETAGIIPPVDVQPQITVSKADSPDPVFNGSNIVYTITIDSIGNGTAQNVTVHETLPSNVTFVSAQPAPTVENNTWSLGNITNGSTYEVNITVTVNTNATNNSILINNVNVTYENATAQLSYTDFETTTVNETAGIIPPVLNDTQPLLTINKADTPDPVFNGSNIVYTISINNIGNGTAQNVTVHETLPSNVTFVSSQPVPTVENATWALGNLSNGSSYDVNITVQVHANATNNSILTNNVNVTYENATAQFSITDLETTTVNETAGIPPPPVIFNT